MKKLIYQMLLLDKVTVRKRLAVAVPLRWWRSPTEPPWPVAEEAAMEVKQLARMR